MAEKKLEKKPVEKTGIQYPKIKTTRLPKSLGACVDVYHALREQRLAAKRHMEECQAEETRVFNHILDSIPKGDGGAVGKKFKAVRKEEDVYSISDDTAFYAFVKKTGSFDLLNRAINQRAVRERMEDPKFMKSHKGGVPGTKAYKRFTLSVTKVK